MQHESFIGNNEEPKDTVLLQRIIKKIKEIVENPEIDVPKHHELKGYRTLHVDPFVIFY